MIKKNVFFTTVSFLLAIIIIIGIVAIREKGRTDSYKMMIKNHYLHAFEQLNSSLNNISVSTQKTIYVSSAKKMGALAVEIFNEAELAKSALAELPIEQNNVETIYRFLSQVGNYALSVSKNITSENGVTPKQKEELRLLSETAKTITGVINDAQIEYNNPDEWARMVENQLNNSIDVGGLANSLTELEENLSDYPTFVFDGPYSDHILQKTPLMTAAAKEYSKEAALSVAKKIASSDDISFLGMQAGKIECYCFGNEEINVAVSKKGGYILYLRKGRSITKEKITYEDAIFKAQAFLNGIDFPSMVDTYYYTDNGVCVINFAYSDGETICYTDLIKVGVAMDTGEIMLLETAGYITNHTVRTFREPKYSLEQAAERISSDLSVEKSGLALIPTDGGGEVRCYEFLCKTDEKQEILVYINMQTLEEEQIYILLKNDGGTLVK